MVVILSAILIPSRYNEIQSSLDCIAEWSSNYAVTTTGIISRLLQTIDMNYKQAQEYIERREVDHMSTINGSTVHTDPINDLLNRDMLLDEYMNVRELLVLPLASAIDIGRFISIQENGVIYEIRYSPPTDISTLYLKRNGC